ncbi:hypothetical protein BASA81_011426 [Batrachochytrium salamandrivorans]|nr:hypothetical protein BASA81_011426 [Batrachochytrium salamandrivorans]
MNADAKDSQRTLLDPDEVVRGTNDDALACKHSAVAAGYLADPFIKAFLKRSPRKAPVINRGTYSRTAALDMLVTKFLTSSAQTTHIHTTQLSKSALQTVANKQIISLGAGSDTRYLLLKAAGLNPHRYIEIDYPQVTAKKAQALMKDKDTRQMIDLDHGQVFGGGTGITTDSYWLIPGDLREFASVLMPKLISMGLDTG